MVTYDRSFLDVVCDRILELDHGKLVSIDEFAIPRKDPHSLTWLLSYYFCYRKYEYTGSYADFLQGQGERLALEDSAVQTAKQAKYRLELEWLR